MIIKHAYRFTNQVRSSGWVGLLAFIFLLSGCDPNSSGKEGASGKGRSSGQVHPNQAPRRFTDIKGEINDILTDGITDIRNGNDVDRELGDIYTKLFALIDDENLSLPELNKAIVSILNQGDMLMNQKKLPPEFGARILSRFSRREPFKAWEFMIGRYQDSWGFRPLVEEASTIVRQMAAIDLNRTLEIDRKGELPRYSKAEVFASYLKTDEEAARSWMDGFESTLSEAARNRFYQIDSEYLVEQGKFADAWKLIDQIHDPVVKKRVEGQIWTAERDSLRQEVAKNPPELLQSIVSGKSNYNDYWLEEAMSTWVAKDFDKAQEWYQKNWNSMPANKSQYLAAAFAKQAIGQGDVATARQWAAHIQDAKTKQRIETGIAEAESKNGN
jgi:hypothetical protein